jgi:hypothetical protein
LVADEFFVRGLRVSGTPISRGRLIRFGPDDVGGVVSAAALVVATAVSTGSLETFGQMASHGLVDRVRRWRQGRRRLRADPNAPVRPPEDTTQALLLMVSAARRCGLSEAEAAQLVTAVLAEARPPE